MKKITLSSGLLALMAALWISGQATFADDKEKPKRGKDDAKAEKKADKKADKSEEKGEKKANPEGLSAEDAAWMEASIPGAAHKALEPLAGRWDAAIKTWMAPGAPPAETKGSSYRHWILGGRFLQEEFKGTMMEMPFEGIGVSGYDNIKKEYVGNWMDTMMTGILVQTGKASEDGKLFTYLADFTDPVSKQVKKQKITIRIDGKDKNTFEMFEGGKDGKDTKMMEIVYTRQKQNGDKKAEPEGKERRERKDK